MTSLCGILVDLDLCTGCYACEVSCKQENNVPVGTNWIKVLTIGPETIDSRQRMDFLPIMTEQCTLCARRIKDGLEPRCVNNCPTQALEFCDDTGVLLSLLQSDRRWQICKLEGLSQAFG